MCTDAAVSLHVAITVVEQQSLGGIQDLFLLYFSFLWEKDLLRHRIHLFWIAMPVAGRGFCNSFWIFFFIFFKEENNLIRGSLCNWFHLCPKRVFSPSDLPTASRFTAPELGEEVAVFAGTRQIPGSWSAALQLLSLPCSSCSCVCFLLSHVLTLLFPPGSQRYAWRSPARPWPRKSHWLLAQPTSRGPGRGEWDGAETQPGALLDGGRALWAHCSLPTRLVFLSEKLEVLFHPELL